MSFDIWRTLFTDDFDTDKYLYHYTNIASAIKIICNNTLLFSKISKTNDTSEAKTKITFAMDNEEDFDSYTQKTEAIYKYFNQYIDIVQLLCFSMDVRMDKRSKLKALEKMNSKDIYYDVSGRGFALPRMWAQYANNNQGICFIINKSKILNNIENMIAFSKCHPVKYKHFYSNYIIEKDQMNSLYDKVSMFSNGRLTLLNMIQNDDQFLRYNFFEKLEDWSNEHEYRILALIDKHESGNDRLKITNFSSYLEGVVLGEKMDKEYEQVIRLLIENKMGKCNIKKISFVNQRYILK